MSSLECRLHRLLLHRAASKLAAPSGPPLRPSPAQNSQDHASPEQLGNPIPIAGKIIRKAIFPVFIFGDYEESLDEEDQEPNDPAF